MKTKQSELLETVQSKINILARFFSEPNTRSFSESKDIQELNKEWQVVYNNVKSYRSFTQACIKANEHIIEITLKGVFKEASEQK